MASAPAKVSSNPVSLPKSAGSTGALCPSSANDDSQDARARTICAEFDVEIIPAHLYPVPGQTRAINTLRRILAKLGEGHLRLVLSTLSETKGNAGLITESTLWATSDLVRACSKWIEEDVTSWLDAWDKIPMGFILWHIQELTGKSHTRHALAGAMYLMLVYYSRGKKADHEVGYGFIRRMQKAENELSSRELQTEEVIEIGKEFCRVKEALPCGEWLPWVRENAGLSYGTVLRYMRLAAAVSAEEAVGSKRSIAEVR